MQVVVLPYQSAEMGHMWKAAVMLPKERGIKAMQDLLTAFISFPSVLRKLRFAHGNYLMVLKERI